jgi:hypothetical protein
LDAPTLGQSTFAIIRSPQLVSALSRPERLIEIGNDVVDVLEAHAEPNHADASSMRGE